MYDCNYTSAEHSSQHSIWRTFICRLSAGRATKQVYYFRNKSLIGCCGCLRDHHSPAPPPQSAFIIINYVRAVHQFHHVERCATPAFTITRNARLITWIRSESGPWSVSLAAFSRREARLGTTDIELSQLLDAIYIYICIAGSAGKCGGKLARI